MGVPTMVHGENAVLTVSGGINVAVDGEVDMTIEKNVVEKNLRGVAVIYHILSKKVKISGSFTGVPNTGIWQDIVKPFLGADEISAETDLSTIGDQDNMEITMTVENESFVLLDVKITQVKPQSPNDDVVSAAFEFVANGVKTGSAA